MDRVEIARVFKIRSDESFAAAERCLEKKHNRAAINRSWYSVMQMITAATYLILVNKKPPSDQPNWNHRLQGGLFQELASRKTGVPKELYWKDVLEIEGHAAREPEDDVPALQARCFAHDGPAL